ncbi:MAG: flagellar hook-associated protein FlgL [Porticoccaceae bacterium]|nr:flagellar hook-associated protein FlgL [Pseudomonadales bacterium]MCP5173016.1 flagellar hook-associated protein FlgL [Pseudomonadales bacterium]MCP5302489.1 flagellar hook-associated protein FlgL [Pseudomonadales bacterium]
MRLSSVQIFQQGISGILEQQAKLQHTEQQLATGRRVLTPSDDPVAAAQILDITEDLELMDQYQRNGNLAETHLRQEEAVLDDVGNLLQRVRELVVQANNASQSPETRQAIAVEIEAQLDGLQALANSQNADGDYIFAGFQNTSEPFTKQGNTYSYNGDDGQRLLQVGRSSQVAIQDSGLDVFVAVPSGNGRYEIAANPANSGTAVAGTNTVQGNFVADNYTITFSQATPADPITYQVTDGAAAVIASGNYVSGENITFGGASIGFDGVPADGDSFQVTPSTKQDMFSTLQDIVSVLQGSGSAPAEIALLNTAMGQALENLDQGIGQVLDVRAAVGVRLNQVENQLNINDSFKLQMEETLSDIQDLDYAEAISRLNLQLTALQAAQQAYVKVQGLSLFNYL